MLLYFQKMESLVINRIDISLQLVLANKLTLVRSQRVNGQIDHFQTYNVLHTTLFSFAYLLCLLFSVSLSYLSRYLLF